MRRSLSRALGRAVASSGRSLGAGALALAASAVGTPAAAHEIPSDVVAHVYVKPEGGRLRLLVRVPLEAMRDVDFPLLEGLYLDVAAAGPSLRDAARLWIAQEMRLFEGARALPTPEVVAVRASLPSAHSFASWETALAHTLGPALPASTRLVWKQALLDVLLEVPIASEASRFSIRPGLERLGIRVVTVLRFLPPDGPERTLHLAGGPGLVRLDPSWRQAALGFLRLGFLHILDGVDHLLFLLCLVLPLRRVRPLVLVVTAFTVAHSATLVGAAYGLAPDALWFPSLVETLIAASIVAMAIENVIGASLGRRWAVAFAFGLVHGFGFSFALQETLQLAGRHVLTSLLSFNVGVELGQLLVVALVAPALGLLFRRVVPERTGILVVSVLVAHTGWHWMTERWETFRAYPLGLADLARILTGTGARWVLGSLLVAALIRVALARLHPAGSRPGLAVAADEGP